MKSSGIHHPWYFKTVPVSSRTRSLFVRYHVICSLTFILFMLTVLLILLIFQDDILPITKPPRIKLVPIAQFNRGYVNKQEVLENARVYMQKLMPSRMNSVQKPRDLFNYLLQTKSNKEKRHFLSLEAFGISNMSDFEELIDVGYELKTERVENSTRYKYLSTEVEYLNPDYKILCYKSALTLSHTKRATPENFCSRLKSLEERIRQGTELPLLTLFTWWPNPLGDPEGISKRATMVNWDLLRPFVIPVMLSNFRLNMAAANVHGWPCVSVQQENYEKAPMLRDAVPEVESLFKSTFYGYAMVNTLFDSTLLETLMVIKERHTSMDADFSKRDINTSKEFDWSSEKRPVLIHGKSALIPAFGTEVLKNIQSYHRHVEMALPKNENKTELFNTSYIIYRGLEFKGYDQVYLSDDHLIPYLVHRSVRDKVTTSIDTTETVLSARIHRYRDINDWGRRPLKTMPRDFSQNDNDEIVSHVPDIQENGEINTESELTSQYVTKYDEDTDDVEVVAVDDN